MVLEPLLFRAPVGTFNVIVAKPVSAANWLKLITCSTVTALVAPFVIVTVTKSAALSQAALLYLKLKDAETAFTTLNDLAAVRFGPFKIKLLFVPDSIPMVVGTAAKSFVPPDSIQDELKFSEPSLPAIPEGSKSSAKKKPGTTEKL